MELQVFKNAEFGEIRAVEIDGEPWFVGKDVAQALGYVKERNAITAHVEDEDKKDAPIQGDRGGKQNMTVINESGLYALLFSSKLDSAKRFKRWVTSEVLPAIRKTGRYEQIPHTTGGQIQLLAKGYMELEQNIAAIQTELSEIKSDAPLYSCEIDEVQQHVRRKGVQMLGGKTSEAYRDASLRGSVYSDIYNQLKREYGCVSTYKSIKRRYLADVHEYIDTYSLPTALGEQVAYANAQQSLDI